MSTIEHFSDFWRGDEAFWWETKNVMYTYLPCRYNFPTSIPVTFISVYN